MKKLLALSLFFFACGQTPSSSNASDGGLSPSSDVIDAAKLHVSVSPKTVTLAPGGKQQFTATVTGSSNGKVNWIASAGSITSGGLFTAPSKAGKVTVTAQSQANKGFDGSAAVTVSTNPGSSGDSTGGSSGSSTGSSTGASSGTSSGGFGAPKHTSGVVHILFDGAHGQTKGNADWIIDTSSPLPANPTSPTTWNGGISSWGYALFESGRYDVHELLSGALSFGDGGAGDLSAYDVFVTDEPGLAFAPSESQAIAEFIQSGGGAILIADHKGATRCSTGCIQAYVNLNTVLSDPSGLAKKLGMAFDGNEIAQGGANGTSTNALFTNGPFGNGATIAFDAGTTSSVTSGNPLAQVAFTGAGGSGGYVVISALPSGGRVAIIGDSSPTDDGTCASCGANLFDGWTVSAGALLNLTAWVANDNP